jgi:hypothetical protein
VCSPPGGYTRAVQGLASQPTSYTKCRAPESGAEIDGSRTYESTRTLCLFSTGGVQLRSSSCPLTINETLLLGCCLLLPLSSTNMLLHLCHKGINACTMCIHSSESVVDVGDSHMCDTEQV